MDPRILSLDSLSARKSLSTFLKSPNNQSVFKAQPELYAYLYVNKFNTTLQSMQENAYKSKNTDLFTWKQTEKYQNKITSPPSIDKKMVQMSILVNAHQPKDLNSAVTEPGLYTQTAPDIQGPRSLIAMDGTGSGVYQPRRKKLQKSQKKFYDTANGTFKTQIKLDSHKFTLPTPPVTHREKTYSVMAVQKGLLDDRDSPLHQVPNYQYMSNQFDRKNQTVNKIISKIHTKEDLLNREQVIEETLQKMEYVVKDIKLHKYLKPKTAAPFLNTRKPLSMAKTHRDTRLNDFLGNINNNGGVELIGSKSVRTKSQKSNPYGNELYKSANFAQTTTGFRNSIPAIEKLPEEPFKEEPPLRLIDKNDLQQRVQLMRKVHGIEKNDTKTLFQNIDAALGKFQTGSLEDTEETVSRPVTNAEKERKESKFVIRLQSRGSPMKKSMSPPQGIKAFGPASTRATREIRESNIMTSSCTGLPKLSDDNILNFGTYFKKKYMEQGLPFDMSKDLSAKIKNFENNIGQSMKRINTPRKDDLKLTDL